MKGGDPLACARCCKSLLKGRLLGLKKCLGLFCFRLFLFEALGQPVRDDKGHQDWA